MIPLQRPYWGVFQRTRHPGKWAQDIWILDRGLIKIAFILVTIFNPGAIYHIISAGWHRTLPCWSWPLPWSWSSEASCESDSINHWFKTAKPNQFPTIGKILTTLKIQSLLDILTLLTTLTLQTALTLQSILPIQINSMMLQTRRRLSGTSAVVERGKKQSPKSNQVIDSWKYKPVLDYL